MGQMDLVVNLWDNVFNKVCICYLDSTFIGNAWHQDLFDLFISALDSLDLKKLQHMSVDDPNVNWAFFSELPNYRTENDMSKLLSTGSCGLLAIHGAFKTGQLGELITLMWPEVVDSPLPFCGTQWIEDKQVAVQVIEIWDDTCQLCTFWLSLPKSKQPSSHSYLMLLSATKDPLILAKLHFFSYIAGNMKPFLAECQYTKPMMSFMHDDLHQLLRNIASKNIKLKMLEKYKNASVLCDDNFSDTKNYLENKEVDIGFGANKILTEKMKTDNMKLMCVQLIVWSFLSHWQGSLWKSPLY